MPAPHVLVLRLYVRPSDPGAAPVLVCEDTETGRTSGFGSAEELWRIVQAKLVAAERPRTRRRGTRSGPRTPSPTSKESP